MDKNYPRDNTAIKELVEIARPQEKRLALFLGNLFLEKTSYLEVISGNSDKGEKARYDLDVLINNRKDEPKTLLKIECEVGLNQPQWKECIPSNWSHLNLLARKDYSKSDVFIKHNIDMTSMFAFDCDWIVKLINSGEIKEKAQNHNLGILTSNKIYPIPFDMALNNPEHAVVCEYSKFDNLLEFLFNKMNKMNKINKVKKYD